MVEILMGTSGCGRLEDDAERLFFWAAFGQPWSSRSPRFPQPTPLQTLTIHKYLAEIKARVCDQVLCSYFDPAKVKNVSDRFELPRMALTLSKICYVHMYIRPQKPYVDKKSPEGKRSFVVYLAILVQLVGAFAMHLMNVCDDDLDGDEAVTSPHRLVRDEAASMTLALEEAFLALKQDVDKHVLKKKHVDEVLRARVAALFSQLDELIHHFFEL